MFFWPGAEESWLDFHRSSGNVNAMSQTGIVSAGRLAINPNQ